MQGITKFTGSPWLEHMNRKTMPAKPATQSEVTAPEVVAAVMADCHEKGYDAAELNRLYRELTEQKPSTIDRTQFNYGRCLPWKTRTETPAEYLRTQYLWKAIAERMAQFSAAEWELGQALAAVEHADNAAEYTAAIAKLKAVRAANDLLGIDWTYNQANMPAEPEDYTYGENI